jgi:hypothetical protein
VPDDGVVRVPDMYSTRSPGASVVSHWASSRPPISGMTTSVRRRSAGGPAANRRTASAPPSASTTVYPAARNTVAVIARSLPSSSTSRIVSLPRGGAGLDGLTAASSASGSATGQNSLNVVPFPTSLYTSTCPPDCLTIPWTVASPSPVPFPNPLVVKNGSNRWAFVSSVIPAPLSVTARRAYRPGRTSGRTWAYAPSSSAGYVSTVSRPPVGMASRALTARLVSTCSTCPGSAITRPRSGCRTVVSRMSSPIRRASILAVRAIRSFRSVGRGWRTCLRLNARSWRVSSAARRPASMTSATYSAASPPAGRSARSSSEYPLMMLSRLLKSWAIPPARWPTASIFWAWRNCSSSRRYPVMSRWLATKWVTAPRSSATGAIRIEFQNGVPSFL